MGNFFKNANPYWAATTGLAVWFLFWHAPQFWKNRKVLQIRDFALAIHILAAATIYLACAHNLLVTPSLHPYAKLAHTWIGRVGLVSGIVSFSLGVYLAWSRLAIGEEDMAVGSTTLGFAIPITIGGILQIISEISGFRAIRTYKSLKQELQEGDKLEFTSEYRRTLEEKKRQALQEHITGMVSLFVLACGIPAGIRLAEFIGGGDDSSWTIAMIVVIIVLLQSIANRYIATMTLPPPTEPNAKPILLTSYNSISD